MSKPLHHIGVVGAGAMGAGIAQVAAQAGCAVTVTDVSEAALAKGHAGVSAALQAAHAKGKLAAGEAQAILARISWSVALEDHAHAQLLIEAIVEEAEPKRALFLRLQDIAPHAVMASNTSSLSITALAQGLAAPKRFAGFHFFNPAPLMKLVEVVRGSATDPAVTACLLETAKAWGKHAVLVRDVPGFIVNRVARPFYSEGWRALEEGVASPEAIDAALRLGGGFRMGPLELGDLIGHDVNYAVACSIHAAYFGRTRFVPALGQARLIASGRLGRKTGAGVYGPDGAPPVTYPEKDGHEGVPVRLIMGDGRSAAAHAADRQTPVFLKDWAQLACPILIGAVSHPGHSALTGAPGKPVLLLQDRPGGLVLRTWLQLANAAADAVRDQVASPADIDAAMCFGLNYPMGPLAWAQAYGPELAVAALNHIAAETGDSHYAPSETLQRAALTGAPLTGDPHA